MEIQNGWLLKWIKLQLMYLLQYNRAMITWLKINWQEERKLLLDKHIFKIILLSINLFIEISFVIIFIGFILILALVILFDFCCVAHLNCRTPFGHSLKLIML